MSVRGCITVSVSYRQQQKELSMLVVQGEGPTLLGRDWLKELQLDWNGLHQIRKTTTSQQLQQVLDDHASVFKEELGLMKDISLLAGGP